MSYRDTIFRRYGSPSKEGRVEIRDYLLLPEQLTEDKIRYYDDIAARTIAECEAVIEALKEYRQALAARYAQLTTAPYKLRLEIERDPHWRNQGVDYYVRIVKTYEDGTEIKELNEHYTGKQRREALARFEELRKQRPGIETVKDIARRSWEK